jgi:threonine/homoserine/homoserine lactone efflux protein
MIDAVKFGCGFALGQAAFPLLLVALIVAIVALWTVWLAVVGVVARARRRLRGRRRT